MIFDFQTKTPVSKILYACLATSSIIWLPKRKKTWKHVLSLNFHPFLLVSHYHADSVAVHSNCFLLFEELFDEKVLLIGHAVTQNHVLVVFESEATENSSHG